MGSDFKLDDGKEKTLRAEVWGHSAVEYGWLILVGPKTIEVREAEKVGGEDGGCGQRVGCMKLRLWYVCH